MNVVIIGHVDHGKSTLIGRLLYDTNSIPETLVAEIERESAQRGKTLEFAYFLDAFEEERERNITVDISETFFQTAKRRYTIIDAPGHKEFLRNMVSGASRADAAILMLDISRGMEEQTRRHAHIIRILGISQIIVAINKMDLVEFSQERFSVLSQEVRAFFARLGIAPRAIVPISAALGHNVSRPSPDLSWYQQGTLLEEIDALEAPEERADQPLRFITQCRIAAPDLGPGQSAAGRTNGKAAVAEQVLLGRVESGSIKIDDRVTLLPSKRRTTVEAIRIWNALPREASVGQSIAVVLKDVQDVERGEVISHDTDAAPKLTDNFATTLFSLTPQPLKVGQEFTLKLATQNVPCKIARIAAKINSATLESDDKPSDALLEAEVGEVTIKTGRPVVIERFTDLAALGRFVIESEQQIMAGGIVREI